MENVTLIQEDHYPLLVCQILLETFLLQCLQKFQQGVLYLLLVCTCDSARFDALPHVQKNALGRSSAQQPDLRLFDLCL